MAVRMIDLAPADREWDSRIILCGKSNRYYWPGFLQVEGEIDTAYRTKVAIPGGIPSIPSPEI